MAAMDELKWDKNGLVTVVVQDQLSGVIRMLAHANREALTATLSTGAATFYSRSRKRLWRKGETSGNTIDVVEVWADCDGDALIYMARPQGPSCHTDAEACFFRRMTPDGSVLEPQTEPASVVARPVLPALWAALRTRRSSDGGKSYTRHLLDAGARKIGEKVREEAGEFDQAIVSETPERVISEAADVLYHLYVGLLARDVDPRSVEAALAERFGVSGHTEKASRKS